MIRNSLFFLTLMIALTTTLVAASAATVSIKSVTGAWTSVDGGTNLTGIGESSVSWGNDLGKGQSGYDFTGTGATGPHDEDTNFALGTFTHRNRPIGVGSSILGAQLAVTLTFFFDDNPLVEYVRTSIFDFSHLETPNSAQPCANGRPNKRGLNKLGCADRVTAETNAGFSETFDVNGLAYMFEFNGFGDRANFWTIEKRRNSAQLTGRFSAVPSPVPLPAAGLLLLAGLGGMAFVGRRRLAATSI